MNIRNVSNAVTVAGNISKTRQPYDWLLVARGQHGQMTSHPLRGQPLNEASGGRAVTRCWHNNLVLTTAARVFNFKYDAIDCNDRLTYSLCTTSCTTSSMSYLRAAFDGRNVIEHGRNYIIGCTYGCCIMQARDLLLTCLIKTNTVWYNIDWLCLHLCCHSLWTVCDQWMSRYYTLRPSFEYDQLPSHNTLHACLLSCMCPS